MEGRPMERERPAHAAAQDRAGVGPMAFATYLPERVQDAAYVAEQSGIAKQIVREKLGICAKRRAEYGDQTSTMALQAARRALAQAEIGPAELDLILYSGS